MPQALSQKTFIVTGANTGIGRVTTTQLARRGARVICACRNPEKADVAIAEIARATDNRSLEVTRLDLADFASVRACADDILARHIPIHGLINNAGVLGRGGQTGDGFELVFATNHLGHYLLTRLLLDHLIASSPARIVNVSSIAHFQTKAIDWAALRQPTQSRMTMSEYAVSKLANVLFTKELARRLEGTGVTTYAVHPGGVATDIYRNLPRPMRWALTRIMMTPEKGAASSLRCATAPELARDTGLYYDADGQEKPPSPLAEDADLARTLWAKSAAWTGVSDALAAPDPVRVREEAP